MWQSLSEETTDTAPGCQTCRGVTQPAETTGEIEQLIRERNYSPEYAVSRTLRRYAKVFQSLKDNLGTVPVYVNDAMARHKISGMHVGEFGVETNPQQALQPPPHQAVASLNTHDTATFMGFWSGAEIDDRVALGLVDAAQAEQEHRYRLAQRAALIAFLHAQGDLPRTIDDPEAVLHAWLIFLARQDQDFLLINLEDLWLESDPQNVPGTWEERPNWRRKARLSLAELRGRGTVTEFLKTINDNRSQMR